MASGLLKGLYKLGARRIAFLGLTPLGCLPSQRTLNGGAKRVCVELFNDAARMFNSKLASKLQILGTTLPQARFAYVDGYGALMEIIQAPREYGTWHYRLSPLPDIVESLLLGTVSICFSVPGFDVVDRGCCGTGLVETALMCNRWVPGTCSNVSRFLFWDSYHPTERAYRILLDKLLGKIVQDIFRQ